LASCTQIPQRTQAISHKTEPKTKMMEPVFQAVPVLRIFDVDKAKDFYAGFLGFQVDWEYRFEATAPVYMQVSKKSLVLHLTEHHGDCCPGSTVLVLTTELDSLHREIMAKDYPYMRPGIEMAPWNAKVMEVTDPFGNRLRFNEDIEDETPAG
jgi:catechol 2,3-dioxygenase-like lactoylglutathione lyase family enzyme